ncbi:B3 domain-containing protein [Senna tora]|uniref:B3 domain-containing protein n=1 Tax=Senna tora TaxID=362788 RepID=A0A834XGR7_9FABA|nr:B3 domain-containing protein [Senna tora]
MAAEPNKNNNIINYKYNPSSSSSRKSKSQLLHSNNNNSIMQWGYSTALKLYDDPWKIKKVLTASDLGKLNRLLLSSNSIESLIGEALGHNNNHIDQEEEEEEMMNRVGKIVRVCDVDTMSMHELVLKRWASFKNYVMIGDWNQDFVKRRGLKKGDEIGLHWDSYNNCFNFSLLKPA